MRKLWTTSELPRPTRDVSRAGHSDRRGRATCRRELFSRTTSAASAPMDSGPVWPRPAGVRSSAGAGARAGSGLPLPLPPSGPSPAPGLQRLTRSADYARIQSTGRRVRSRHLLLVVGSGMSVVSRVGLTVSRKVGPAVVRNRVKRWLREAVRAVPSPAGGPWDLVLIPRAETAVAGLAVLRLELAELFSKVGR